MRQSEIRDKPKRRGNYVPGKGRARGSRNRRSIELENAMQAAEERLRRMDGTLQRIDAHGLLTVVYQDMENPLLLRVQAAIAAIRYEKPALSATQVDAHVTVRLGLAEELTAAQRRLALAGTVHPVLAGAGGSATGPHSPVMAFAARNTGVST